MLKIFESSRKEMDIYTFIDAEKFIKWFYNIGHNVKYYKEKFGIY